MNASQHAEFHQEVLADIAACEQQLDELRAIAKYHAAKAQLQDNGDHATSPQQATGKKPARNRSSGKYSKLPQIKAAQLVLQEAGEPLRTAEIARRMIAGGFPTKDTARTKMSIFTSMTRKDDVFRKTGPGIWALVATDSESEAE